MAADHPPADAEQTEAVRPETADGQPADSPRTPDEERDALKLTARTIRGLAMDGVQAANSGHPGMPMGMADVATVLWTRFLKHNPQSPDWPDRDRFVLSAGHGSMLIYSLLHLSGYDLPLDELRTFRQLGSKTPGHPEVKHTPGVETTTGPLGQGLATAVGMALAEKHLAARFNTPETMLVDHYTYVVASDGDLMEGVSNEASSLAGHLGLGKLVVLWDDNEISIDGPTSLSFGEDVVKRYDALGWHTQRVDGHDPDAVEEAIRTARATSDRPSLVACRTTIGFGSPNRAGTASAHGEPLGADELAKSKLNLGIPLEPTFFVPDGADALLREQAFRGMEAHCAWTGRFDALRAANGEKAAAWESAHNHTLPDGWEGALPTFDPSEKGEATRNASGQVLAALTETLPWLVGGSADLTPSNKTKTPALSDFSREHPEGRYLRFGVREHAMGAVLNGLTLHGGLRGFGGTFLIFSDYMKPAVRLAALMKCPTLFVYTHDSIGLGEDGPTHQPIEQLAGLRAIPNLHVWRPADANETTEAWKAAILRTDGPSALAFTRQNVPTLDRSTFGPVAGTHRGAYVLADAEGQAPDVLLIGTGSEVHLALEARALLAAEGIQARVISMPCAEVFDAQDEAYRRAVLPPSVRARVAVEAASPFGWERYVGLDGAIVAIDRFGESAPFDEVYAHLGVTAQAVADAARRVLRGASGEADDDAAEDKKGGTPESEKGGRG